MLGKWIRVLHGKFWIKCIHSIILGNSLQNAGLVLFSLVPKPRVFVLGHKTAESKAVNKNTWMLEASSI
jgi:hypothetical protein